MGKILFEAIMSAIFGSARYCRAFGAACPIAATAFADFIWDGITSLWRRFRGRPPEHEIERSVRAIEYIKKLDEAEKVKSDDF